jgi:hypothetical protein
MRRPALAMVVSLLLGACASAAKPRTPSGLPAAMGERSSGFGYIPLDGLTVSPQLDFATCFADVGKRNDQPPRPLLEALPDVSVRFAVASLDASGALSFGPAKVTAKGQTYRAVLDYVNVDALPFEFLLRKNVKRKEGDVVTVGIGMKLRDGDEVLSYEAKWVQPLLPIADAKALRDSAVSQRFEQVTIPIYVGIGMRLSADILARRGEINLTSLGNIAAEAQTNALSGTLTVQTLGITGKSIATALPLPSKLDQTTVENGILALGSSRALIYNTAAGGGDVTTTARVVGMYSPVGADPRLINAIYSELARVTPTARVWNYPCVEKKAALSAK